MGRIIGENNIDRVRTWVTVVCDGCTGQEKCVPRYFLSQFVCKKKPTFFVESMAACVPNCCIPVEVVFLCSFFIFLSIKVDQIII